MLAVVTLVSNVNELLLINVPAVAAVYQSIVSPAPGVAPTVILPGPHLDALTATGALTLVRILANTAVLAEKHPNVVFDAT